MVQCLNSYSIKRNIQLRDIYLGVDWYQFEWNLFKGDWHYKLSVNNTETYEKVVNIIGSIQGDMESGMLLSKNCNSFLQFA